MASSEDLVIGRPATPTRRCIRLSYGGRLLYLRVRKDQELARLLLSITEASSETAHT
jgi:hypothetical protein